MTFAISSIPFLIQSGLMHKGLDPGLHIGPFLSVVDRVQDRKVLVGSERLFKDRNQRISDHAV